MSDRRWTRGGLALAAACTIALALVAGFLASRLADPDEEAPAPALRVVRLGPLELSVPDVWERATPRSTGIAGLDSRRAVVLDPSPGLQTRVIAMFAPADHPSLIPAALRSQLRDVPAAPLRSSLAGRPAWAYPLLVTRGTTTANEVTVLDVTVLPTTAGVLALACTAPAAQATASDCATGVEQIAVQGAATLRPSPAVALASRLPVALARLDRARIEDRVALARARTPARQATLARRLQAHYRAAARSLRPAAAAEWSSTIAAFERTAAGYDALARAADDGSRPRFAAARRALGDREQDLAAAIDEALAAGSRRTAAPVRAVPPAAEEPRTGPRRKHVLLVLAVLLSLAAGFALGGPAASMAAGVRARRAGP